MVIGMPFQPAPRCRMGKIVIAVACLLFSASSLAGRDNQTFKGQITDSSCSGPAGHAAMLKKGETTAECAIACVKMGAKYVLSNPDDKTLYPLDDQKRPEAFAGKNVIVIGTLDKTSGSIRVTDMIRALPSNVTKAKSAEIECDACPRAMGKAGRVALQGMLDWGRFEVVGDRKQADLILLFSANPYLGDYLTRDKPDTRPVSVEHAYLNVIDPSTGESVWGDFRQWGGFRVTAMTKDLILEFRAHLEAEEGQTRRLLLLEKTRTHKAPPGIGK
jgi:hypothetical protein